MNKPAKFFGFRSLAVLSIYLFTVSISFAAVSEKNYQLLSRELSQRIQVDLANDAAAVQLKNVEEYKISKSEIGLKGDAVCIAGESRMPLQFDVRVSTEQQKISAINYNFVEDAADYAPTSSEDVLMKELMTQIRRDYKTTDIVIAIDRVDDGGVVGSQRNLSGSGEVRIGDMVWNDIKFAVALDVETQKAKKITYTIDK